MTIDTVVAASAVAAGFSDELAELAERLRAGVVQVRAGGHGIGSGVIWRVDPPDASGEAETTLITNAHVVRAAREPSVTIQLRDGRELKADVTAVDPGRDLAALRLRASGLTALEIGDSSALRVGEIVLAVGNPFGRFNALTFGVVAARAPADPELTVEPAETPDHEAPPAGPRDPRGRWRLPRLEVIQADLRLYPGNSGGPLTDARGRVVGVNSMVGGGLAFAIPSATVRQFLSEVERATERPYLGVQVLSVELPEALRARHGLTQPGGALIAAIEAGSPAERADLIVGDVLLAVNGAAIPAAELLPRILARSAPSGDALTLSLLRGGEKLELTLQPAVRAAA